MAGAAVEVTTNVKEVQGVFAKAQGMLRDMTPFMRIVGEIVRTSVVENFQQGGRPEKWAPLSPVTTRRRQEKRSHQRVEQSLFRHVWKYNLIYI